MKKSVMFEREKLLGILGKLTPGLATNDMMEQSTNFVFKDSLVWSFNNEIAVSHPLPEDFEIMGAVPAEPLLKFLSKGSEKLVELSIVETELIVSCGRSKAGILLNDVKLPIDKIPFPGQEDWIKLPEDFVEKLSLVNLSVGKKISMGALSCAYITKSAIFGCDNFQLTVASFPDPIENFKSILLQKEMASHVLAFSPDMIGQTSGWTHFANKDDVVISCRATEGEYPDVSPLFNIEGDTIKFPSTLCGILERARIFTGKQDENGKVSLALDKSGLLRVVSRNEHGWFKESLTLSVKYPEFQMEINPEIFRNALRLDQTFVVGKNALLINGKDFKHVIALV